MAQRRRTGSVEFDSGVRFFLLTYVRPRRNATATARLLGSPSLPGGCGSLAAGERCYFGRRLPGAPAPPVSSNRGVKSANISAASASVFNGT